MSGCSCGLLDKLVGATGSPLVQDALSERYVLRLAKDEMAVVSHCPHCGCRISDFPCNCGEMFRWCGVPGSVLVFDAKRREFNLLFGDVSVPFRYCAHCGGRLARTRRREGLKRRSRKEEFKYIRLLKGAETLEEVVQRLGPPDEQRSYAPEGRPNTLGDVSPRVLRSFLFRRVGSTVRIIAQELEDHKLRIIFTSQPRERVNPAQPNP